MSDLELIKVSTIMQKFMMCYNNHRLHQCEYCNCEKCSLNTTDEEFDLMKKYIKQIKIGNTIPSASKIKR